MNKPSCVRNRFIAVVGAVFLALTLVAAVAPAASAAPVTPTASADDDLCVVVSELGAPVPDCEDVAAQRDTPDGYKLFGGVVTQGRTTYDSRTLVYNLVHQGDVVCKHTVQMHQQLAGYNDREWLLWVTVAEIPGSCNSGVNTDLEYETHCGVNIHLGNDLDCVEYAELEGTPFLPSPSFGPIEYTSNDVYIKSFGYETNVTKFPMVRIVLNWFYEDNYETGEGKFRGYDTCVEPHEAALCDQSDGEIG